MLRDLEAIAALNTPAPLSTTAPKASSGNAHDVLFSTIHGNKRLDDAQMVLTGARE